jgi:hypothetical protein
MTTHVYRDWPIETWSETLMQNWCRLHLYSITFGIVSIHRQIMWQFTDQLHHTSTTYKDNIVYFTTRTTFHVMEDLHHHINTRSSLHHLYVSQVLLIHLSWVNPCHGSHFKMFDYFRHDIAPTWFIVTSPTTHLLSWVLSNRNNFCSGREIKLYRHSFYLSSSEKLFPRRRRHWKFYETIWKSNLRRDGAVCETPK